MKFRHMNDSEIDKFFGWMIPMYAQDLIKSGQCNTETALERAKKDVTAILPQGKDTPNNYIYTMENDQNEDLGYIWYSKYNDTMAFICDFFIIEKFRKKGYGKQTLLLLEDEVKKKNLNKICLHVFTFNEPAISLYKSVGYKIVKEEPGSMYMLKEV